MCNKLISMVVAVVVVFAATGVQAESVRFLDNYAVTNDVNDVVHLGDQTINTFVRPVHQGEVSNWTFDLPVAAQTGGVFNLHLDHYQVDQDLGYMNYVYLNSTSLGYLVDDYDIHWYPQEFTGGNNLLKPTSNTLTISAGLRGNNYDDFEFTNLYLTYAAVPEPSTLALLVAGAVAVLFFWRRRKA